VCVVKILDSVAVEPYYQDDSVALLNADCVEAMRLLPDNCIDAIVTDPPYELNFMGRKWDGTGIANNVEMWSETLRIAKPGAHLLTFGGTRTYHRMACAVEDAGWEVRDCIMWIYGSGFPKSLDVSKAIDKTAPATESAKQWEGYGTALKPAYEPVLVARKPLDGTVANNVQKHGCGAINIDGCRVEIDPNVDDPRLGGNGTWSTENAQKNVYGDYSGNDRVGSSPKGRFPANVIHDGSDEVVSRFPESAGQQGDVKGTEKSRTGDENTNCYGEYGRIPAAKRNDSGSAARFFYCAKASGSDRGNLPAQELPLFGESVPEFRNTHPTVKPTSLMEYLVTLVNMPTESMTILDPFSGSGSTGVACKNLGVNAILIEREKEYCEIIKQRLTR